MKSFVRFFSFGNNDIVATFLYLGLGFVMLSITPELPKSFAQCTDCTEGCGGEEPCADGLVCQDGECVCSSE
jgi:hypothetical protein